MEGHELATHCEHAITRKNIYMATYTWLFLEYQWIAWNRILDNIYVAESVGRRDKGRGLPRSCDKQPHACRDKLTCTGLRAKSVTFSYDDIKLGG